MATAMGAEQFRCPGCGGDLAAGHVEGLRQYVCTACGGIVVGIAVLRQLAGAAGQHIWTAEPAPPAGGAPCRCPFCSTEMESKNVPNGTAAICRVDEMVWLDRAAASNLPVQKTQADGPTLAGETEAARCEQCGAPVLHSWDERCQYCGAALHGPTKVVVLPTELDGDGAVTTRAGASASGRGGLLAEAMRILARPVDE